MLPKQRREVTLVRTANPGTDLAQGHVGLDQQAPRILHPAGDHVLVRRLSGSPLELAGKVGRAYLRYSGECGQGELLLQMVLDIGDGAPQLDWREPAGRSGKHCMGGGCEEARTQGKGQECHLLFPRDGLRGHCRRDGWAILHTVEKNPGRTVRQRIHPLPALVEDMGVRQVTAMFARGEQVVATS